jgi:hypothetical protein
MHTDEQHESADATRETPDSGGVWGRLGDLLSAAAARLRDALGADSLSVPPEGEVDRDDRSARRDPDVTDALPEAAGGDPGELTVSRVGGRLRVSDGDTYIESDTWEEVER